MNLTYKLVLGNGICTLAGYLYVIINSHLQGYTGTLLEVEQFDWIALISLSIMMHLASFMVGRFYIEPNKRLRRTRLWLVGIAAVPLYLCCLASFITYGGTCSSPKGNPPCHYFHYLFEPFGFGFLTGWVMIWFPFILFLWLMAWLLIYAVTGIIQERKMSKTS